MLEGEPLLQAARGLEDLVGALHLAEAVAQSRSGRAPGGPRLLTDGLVASIV